MEGQGSQDDRKDSFSMENNKNVDYLNTEKFINDKYIETVVNQRFQELSTGLNEQIKDTVCKEITSLNVDFLQCDPQERLIVSLKEEISFLRDEIKNNRNELHSNDKIIEILLSEKYHRNSLESNGTNFHNTFVYKNEESFKCPKRPVKSSKPLNYNDTPCFNRFETLTIEETNDEKMSMTVRLLLIKIHK